MIKISANWVADFRISGTPCSTAVLMHCGPAGLRAAARPLLNRRAPARANERDRHRSGHAKASGTLPNQPGIIFEKLDDLKFRRSGSPIFAHLAIFPYLAFLGLRTQ